MSAFIQKELFFYEHCIHHFALYKRENEAQSFAIGYDVKLIVDWPAGISQKTSIQMMLFEMENEERLLRFIQ